MKTEKCEKLVFNLYNKKIHVSQGHIRTLKQDLHNGLTMEKVHSGIELNQKMWLKQQTDMNTELTTKARGDFQKDFFNLMSNPIFVRKHKDIKLIGEKLFYCRSQTIRQQKFLQIFLAIEINKVKVKMKHSV